MSTVISGGEWLNAPATRAVIEALEAAGGQDCVRFVGGCVRNALMEKPVDDVDLATTLRPETVIEALETAGLKAVPTGLDHGTVTAVASSTPFEITTLRKDVSTDGRNATVAYTTDWALDAQRRDFTFNALYATAAGEVLDPVGQGIDDARARRVVFVGDPSTRIREDYLRILRFFRFIAWYGTGEPEEKGLAACAALKDGLDRLSAERVSKELLKLLSAPDPLAAVDLMRETGVLKEVLPEAGNFERLSAVTGVTTDGVLRLAALLPDDDEVALGVADRLRLSNAQRDRLVCALGPGVRPDAKMSDHEARVALYKAGAKAFRDRLLLAGETDERLMTLASTWERPQMPVTGEDVTALGLKGPEVGEALRVVQDWWLESDFPPDRRAALGVLSRHVKGG